jgi:hypothetical protein
MGLSTTNGGTAASLPPDLQELADEFLAVEGDAERLVEPLDDEQFNWSPAPGAWSIGQCIDHLNVANRKYFDALSAAVDRARASGLTRAAPIRSSWMGRRFIAMLEPPAGMKTRAPRAIRPAVARRHKAEVWPEFVRQHTHLRGCLAEWACIDLNRATFPNPLGPFGRLRAGTALRIMAAHDRRHVWQASRVRGAAGFPRS